MIYISDTVMATVLLKAFILIRGLIKWIYKWDLHDIKIG